MKNKSKLAVSEVCQKCANCCKEFRIIEYDKSWAMRWMLLNHPKIVVEEKKIDGNYIWIVRIQIKCSKLKYDIENKKYYCEIYDEERPSFCEEYPDNITFRDWKFEQEICPIIKKKIESVKVI